jgi:hypothetical protein
MRRHGDVIRIRSLDICALPRRKPSDRYCRAGIGHCQNLGNRGRLANRRLLLANDGLRFGCGDGIKIGVNISNQWPMPFRVGSRQRWPRNKRGSFWRSAHASQRIYDNPAHAGWTDILPVDNALQRQPNLTWPDIIWPPQPISKP